MKRLLALWALALTSVCTAQVAVSPILQPHQTFVDASGAPCAGCKLYSYTAGTTTPLATYTDSSGSSTNTNPIILDAAGGANIWLSDTSYKFILKTAAGVTIWTVDQVKGGGGLGGVCGPAGAVQIANVAVNGLTCDSNITINTSNHTLNVGTLSSNYVTIGALSTPTSWTLDTTSAATACASLGCGSVSSVGLTVPPWLSVAGSPVTGAGVLAVTATPSLTANQFVGTPDGSTGAVGLRSIAPADLPLATTSAFGAVKCDGTTITCTSGVIAAAGSSARTCNSNGCYIVFSDGSIVEWGQITGCITSNSPCSTGVTYPLPFPTSASPMTTTANWSNCLSTVSSPTLSGFSMTFVSLVITGGGGANCPGTQTGNWTATGY